MKTLRSQSIRTWFYLLLVLALPVVANGQYMTWWTNLDGTISLWQFEWTNRVPTTVTIPDTITGRPVIHIVSSAFMFLGNNFITNIVIPDSVYEIDATVFDGCQYLASVTIGTGITNLFNGSFENVGNGGNNAPYPPPPERVGFYFRGNAPNLLDSTVFGRDPKATVYYLPGTLGWSNTFDGLPTAVWTPQMQAVGPSTGTTNQSSFSVNWASGKSVVVEASPTPINPAWTPVTTNTLSGGSFYFSDPQWTNYPQRFYRLRSR
jgi:hypothetical protein